MRTTVALWLTIAILASCVYVLDVKRRHALELAYQAVDLADSKSKTIDLCSTGLKSAKTTVENADLRADRAWERVAVLRSCLPLRRTMRCR